MSRLDNKLDQDYAQVQKELSQLEERGKFLRWQLEYIEALRTENVTSNGDTQIAIPSPHRAVLSHLSRFSNGTIGEVAIKVLLEEGKPLPAIEIARRAMAGGFREDNIERARSHFSAVISKDITSKSAKSRFWQVDRGLIGLVEWENSRTKKLEVPIPLPLPPEPSENSDDIPF